MNQEHRQKMWKLGQSITAAIMQEGMQQYLTGLDGWQRAFELEDRSVRCMDGRTPGGVHLAGSGVLIGLDKAEKFAQAVVSKLGGIDAVTWHPDCGAAKIAASNIGQDSAKLAESFAKELASKLGVLAKMVENQGEDGFHHERVIYYDGTGMFDWSRHEKLPAGFIISRRYLNFDPGYAKDEVKTAIEIALGSHGFGDLFTPESPLFVVPLALNQTYQRDLMAECHQVIGNLPKGDQKRIRIDGAVVEI